MAAVPAPLRPGAHLPPVKQALGWAHPETPQPGRLGPINLADHHWDSLAYWFEQPPEPTRPRLGCGPGADRRASESDLPTRRIGRTLPRMDPTVMAAAIGVGGTVIVGVAGFWANLRNTSKTTALTLRAIELTEQGQVTDRYTRAVEQIGSDKLDVRIGGIYALERVARDSTRDHPERNGGPDSFVRENSHEPWRPGAADDEPVANNRVPETRPDVQAAVTVIGRRDSTHDNRLVDLNTAELAFANLTRANFIHAILPMPTCSPRTSPTRTSPAQASSARTFTAPSSPMQTSPIRIWPTRDLTDANLVSADLTGADLTGADLARADLTNALWISDAVAPEGWLRDANSGRLKSGPH